MIKAVTFDLDGVYFTSDSYSRFKHALPKNISNDSVVDLVLSSSQQMMAFKKGELSESDYWEYVNRNLGADLDIPRISQLLSDSYRLNDLVVDTVRKVRSLGIKTCICTNNFPTRIDALNSKFGFLSDFDVKVISYQLHSLKPDPLIFETLIKQSRCLPEEIIFADDKLANVAAAKNLGINAFLYQGFDGFVKNLQLSGISI